MTPWDTTAAALLDNAAGILERDGWCRGAFKNRKGSHCVVGALRAAADLPSNTNVRNLSSQNADRASYVRALSTLHYALGVSPELWNDSQSDKRAVVRKLRRIARDLRKGTL